jgi:hypothetical protein
MASAQILLTELTLGFSGLLYLSLLTIFNITISLLVFLYSCSITKPSLEGIVKHDYAIAKRTLRTAMDTYNAVLIALVLLCYSWVVAAAYYLPLRGVDDLFYHLPPVFYYIQTHTISLLPTEIRQHFAFPQNAELLFMWPTIFTNSQRMLDSVNVPFVFMSVVVVYALLRNFTIPERDALFAALLYALCPVVIMQSGSNYIDVMVSLFFLISLYYTVLYFQDQRAIYACSAAMSTGIMCGMKYTVFFLSIPLMMVMLWKLCTARRLHTVGYFSLFIALSGWWYIRNAAVLNNPFYPMNLFVSGMGVMGGSGEGSAIGDVIQNIHTWILHFPLEDIGVGSYDGGFGLVFWGLGFSSWVYLFVYSLLHLRVTGVARFVVLMQLPLGFLMLLAVPNNELRYGGRLSIFVVAIGLFAFGAILVIINDKFYKSVIKITCIIFSLLTISLMSLSTMPLFRLDRVITDRKSNMSPSEYKYVMDANAVYSKLRYIWEPLDFLTRDDIYGLNCYVAANRGLFALAPLYGSNLQNRLVIIDDDLIKSADAFIYLYYPDRDLFGNVIKQDIYYPKSKIPIEEVLSSPENVVLTQTTLGCLIVSRSFLRNSVKLKLLRTYYRDTWPEVLTSARQIKPLLKAGVPVITSDPIAYGLLYLELGNGCLENTVLVPTGFENLVGRTRCLPMCYTLGRPMVGYASNIVAMVQINNRNTVAIYLNHAN